MNKYVIDLRPDCKVVQEICESDGKVIIGAKSINYLEELNSDYINEHFGDLQDTAYQKGFEDGKAVNDKGCDGCKYGGSLQGEAPCFNCSNYYTNNWTAKTDDEIRIGDEVKPFYTDITGVVTLIDGDTIYVLWRDGSSTSTMKLKEVTKTGRHFDIASILEDMRCGQ